MGKTTFYIVRHGESLGNATGVLLGRTDLDLSELGHRQAAATAEALRNVHFDKIYSSKLIRAYNTALPHAQLRGMDIIPDAELMEVMIGKWEGKRGEDIIKTWPDAFTPDWYKNYGTYTYPGGESNIHAAERFYNEVVRIAENNPNSCILIASHAAVIRGFWAILTGSPHEDVGLETEFPSNASYSVCEYENGRITPLQYSCDNHLAGVGITTIKFN